MVKAIEGMTLKDHEKKKEETTLRSKIRRGLPIAWFLLEKHLNL
jgi:hypothetical protein